MKVFILSDRTLFVAGISPLTAQATHDLTQATRFDSKEAALEFRAQMPREIDESPEKYHVCQLFKGREIRDLGL